MIRRRKEEVGFPFALSDGPTNGRNIHYFYYSFTIGGWSYVFAYVSIRDAYLPGFKILPSVQFFARMWHVAILVTSGLCRAIYWPPSAASTIYLLPPLLLSSLAIARYISFSLSLAPFSLSPPFPLSFSLFLSSFASFFFCAVSSLSVSLAFFFHLDHRLRSSWINVGTLPLPLPELRCLKLSASIFCSIDSYRATNSRPCE